MNAPFTWPNSADSSRSGGTEPLFTGTNSCSARAEWAWMALAISSLPVPVSPVIRMVARLGATCATRSRMRSMRSLLPTMLGKAVALLQGALELRVLALQAPLRDHAVDLDQQLLVVPGLGEIIVGARFSAWTASFDRAVGGDHEDGRFRSRSRTSRSTSMPERSGIIRSSSTRS